VRVVGEPVESVAGAVTLQVGNTSAAPIAIPMPQSVKVAALSDVAPGGRLSIIVDELPALLLRVGDDLYCIEDVCTHDGQPLTDGPVADCAIECPRHGARFDLRTGKAIRMPATEPVRTFPVSVRNGDVFVDVD